MLADDRRGSHMGNNTDFEATDYFRDDSLFEDPYPFFDFLRERKGPVWIDPRYNVAMVTGHEEEFAALRDHDTFSSINAPTGPFPGLPVQVDGDDATAAIDAHREQMP